MEKSEFQYFTITPLDILSEGRNRAVSVDRQGTISLTSVSPLSNNGPLANSAGISIDHSGALFVIDGRYGHIYYTCQKNNDLIKIPCIGGLGHEPCTFSFSDSTDFHFEKLFIPNYSISPIALTHHYVVAEGIPPAHSGIFGALAVSKQFIAVSDCGNRRVQCFFRNSLQLSFILDSAKLLLLGIEGNWDDFTPWDCVIDSFGDLYVIDICAAKLLRISRRGNYATIMGKSDLIDPVSLFLDDSNALYVLDRGKNMILKKDPGPADHWVPIVTLSSFIRSDRKVLGLALDSNKSFYIGECGNGKELFFHVWNEKGNYTGNFTNPYGNCRRIIAGNSGELFAECADKGIVSINGSRGYAKEGYFYSRVFDSCIPQTLWHRITADATLCRGSSMGIDYVCSEDSIVKPWLIERSLWRTAAEVQGESNTAPDCLLNDVKGQYLALRIRLKGDGDCTPKISRIRIIYPSDSYLRYLPAVYKIDPIGKDLMKRFLSLFESYNLSIEEQIWSITKYLDPQSVPSEFLPWLSSWLGIIRDQHWPEDRFRVFLSRAYTSFQKRGTIEGMSEILEIYTGRKIVIIEHFRYLRPMIIGADIRVGESSVVGHKFTKPLIIEESSTIGAFALIEYEEPPETPFVSDAYDFTVMIDAYSMTDAEKSCIQRIIENEKPAHTRCCLHLGGEFVPKIGNASLGIDSRLAHAYKPITIGTVNSLGVNTIVGTNYAFRGLYGCRSRLATDFYLH